MRHAAPKHRRGFTLVEMLIAVGLVMLMMLLFAQIFATATGSMSKMKGIGENDQRARLVTTLFKGDIEKRSYRRMEALTPENDPATTTDDTLPSDADNQQGYFYYSENSPADDSDDVLQFTINVARTEKNPDVTPVYGRAIALSGDLHIHTNQPECDDGNVIADGTGSSNAAEVSYFLRNGILYRRVMLIRQPYEGNVPTQPADKDGNPFISGTMSGFWRDFDYSAFWDKNAGLPRFAGATASNNSLDNTAGIFALGKPNYRFGHDLENNGNPREYSSNSASGSPAFMGRFTHEETSAAAFGYPGNYIGPSPMTRPLTLNADGVVSTLTGGSRRGEDIVLANVHAFDVKIFDDHAAVNDFRDVGYTSGAVGHFHANNRSKNTVYGPADSPAKNIFDTWHPKIDVNGDAGVDDDDLPPFRPIAMGADGQWGVAGVDDDNAGGVDDPGEKGWPLSDDRCRVKALQIKIRFVDPLTSIMKEVTMVHSLVD